MFGFHVTFYKFGLNFKHQPMEKVTLYQDNAITRARYDLSASQKNVMYMVMSQLGKSDTADTQYYISIKDLERACGKSMNYKQIKEEIDNLVTKKIDIKTPSGNDLTTTFVASAEYLKGRGLVEITLAKPIRPYFFDLKSHFTAFRASTALTISSKYSKRIYELLSSYKNLQTVEVSLEELKKDLFIIDKNKKDYYPRPAQFEARVLKKAQIELLKSSDLNFGYELIKKGRKVDKVRFTIEYIEVQKAIPFDENSSEAMIFQRLTQKFKLRKDQAYAVIDKYDNTTINKILYKIQLDITDNKVHSIGGYTAKQFDVIHKQK